MYVLLDKHGQYQSEASFPYLNISKWYSSKYVLASVSQACDSDEHIYSYGEL